MKAYEFLAGLRPDDDGRFISEYLEFTDEELETVHDYIQWAFPARTPSAFNPTAPLLTDEDVEAIRRSANEEPGEGAAWNFYKMFYKMKVFYETNDHWLVPHDHNHLRITRIIESLRLIERSEYSAEKFLNAMVTRVLNTYRTGVQKFGLGYDKAPSETSVNHWLEKLHAPL